MKSKASKGCWTCKRRKIGCDKNLPYCHNCTRTGRCCGGYGLRLVWTDRTDEERSQAALITLAGRHIQPNHYGTYFLNFVSQDVLLATDSSDSNVSMISRPARSLSLHAALFGQDGMLLSYYENVIATMVSTTRSRNGFLAELLPQVLSNQSASALSLCNAMLAIAAFHQSGPEAAFRYKSNSISHLMQSFDMNQDSDWSESDVSETQIAACMMLCMYSVFDEQDGNWHIHLDGAKKMLRSFFSRGSRSLTSSFLPNWFLYYEVLGNFAQPNLKDTDNTNLTWLWQVVEEDKSLIIGYLGCSIEVFEIAHQVNKLRTSILGSRGPRPSTKIVQQRLELESRLSNLTQRMDSSEESAATVEDRTNILAKAELYRLATLLYLRRVCPVPEDSITRSIYLKQAFDALEVLPVVSSPWPLLIVACESRSDEQRMIILQKLDVMERARNIGNIYVTRDIIESFWKQQDLRVDDGSREELRCWHLVNSDVRVPWFA